MLKHKGSAIIISAPSGTGKSAIINSIISKDKQTQFSVSATTRDVRSGEVNGVNYWFKSNKDFEAMIGNNELLEYEFRYKNYYGTVRSEFQKAIDKGIDVIFDVDTSGALNLKNSLGADAISIMILPPSMEELKQRIIKRGANTLKDQDIRLKAAQQEMSMFHAFDYCVLNDCLDTTINHISSIIWARRAAIQRITNIKEIISSDVFQFMSK